MAINAVTVASKFNLTPQSVSARISKSVFRVDCTALTLFAIGNTDNVTFADIPAGTTILGGSVSVITPATNASGTCTVALIVGGASGTTCVAATTAKTAGAVNGSMANTVTYANADTAVLSFVTATASNTVNPIVEVTLYLIG